MYTFFLIKIYCYQLSQKRSIQGKNFNNNIIRDLKIENSMINFCLNIALR